MQNNSWRDLPILSKITVVVSITLVVAVILVTSLTILREWEAFRTNLQGQATIVLQSLAIALDDPLVMSDPVKAQSIMESFSSGANVVFARVYDTKGKIIADGFDRSRVNSTDTDPFERSLLQTFGVIYDFQFSELRAGEEVKAGGKSVGAVAIGFSTSQLNRTLVVLALQGLLTSLLVAFVGAAVTYSVAQAIMNPLEDLLLGTERVSQGDLEQSIPVTSADELGKLTGSFNDMTRQLRETLQGLEQRVADRTSELARRSNDLVRRSAELEDANLRVERRAAQLQAIADVARDSANLQNLNALLPRIVELVSTQFGYYHVGIFLIDESNEFAILSAANSEGGQRMLARNHKLQVGRVGIVGYVTGTGNPRIALDTDADAVFFNNPDLPQTRSEMALPLRSGQRIIGALDVQSRDAGAFAEEDVKVLTTLADQVSIAIENARLFEQTRRSLDEAETVYRQYIRDEYSRLSRGETLSGFLYAATGAVPLDRPRDSVEIRQARETGEIVAWTDPQDGQSVTLTAPIKLREEIIGVLNIRTTDAREWNQDEIDMVKAVAERVALSVENARLFEETSKRAERERMVADISNKIRSTNDPQAMIRTALQELQKVLGASRVQIVPFSNGGDGPQGETS